VFGVTLGIAVFFVFALPQEPLIIPEVQASMRVGTLADFPPNSARLQSWGSELVLVIRTKDGELRAVEGKSPSTGCVLRWDQLRGYVTSPCSYEIFNPRGYIISGLGDQALRSYPVWIRGDVISIGSAS
jgi:nitrite reductase/ring-hydroxylating ferredoxin subunit